MNTHRPDDEHLPGEDELAALYRRLPRKEPDPALDAAVLRAAAQAVRGEAPAAKRRARWPVALGSAAVLVVAAGLGWRMRDMPTNTPPAVPAAATVQESMQTPVAASVTANAVAEERAVDRTASSASDAAAGAPPPARVPAPAQRAMAAKLRKPEAFASPPPSVTQPATDVQLATRAYSAEAAPAMAAPSPAPQPPSAAAQRMAAVAPAAPPAGTGTTRDAADTPAQELDKIRRLFATHQRDEARQRLADFHRDHPDYPLPDDLREQLLTP